LKRLSNKKLLEAKINIIGRVQGVGFRPFIYRMASKKQLRGYVINLGDAGVEIIVEGCKKKIKEFIKDIEKNAPEVSEIQDIKFVYKLFKNRFNGFTIEKSRKSENVISGIFPPDIGLCNQCFEDINNNETRWFDYPFTACAWCGPRFTSIKSLPYDRERTHMNEFPMCEHCEIEYLDPFNRRFDAQGITCSLCGPKMSLYQNDGSIIEAKDVFAKTAKLLLDGEIIAIKGIGGIHLTSLATEDDIIQKFRDRKNRPYQPFALMSPNIQSIETFAMINTAEYDVIRSWRKPIVLLRKNGKIISELVAPGLDRVGVMLPYTGIQAVLFKKLDVPALVMTSGNKSGLPMVISNKAAFKELKELTDYLLLHDREIINRCDDSVVRIIENRTVFTRRSRGYLPDPIHIPFKKGISLALGAELRNSAAITTNGKAFLTQYLGDITSLESLEFQKNALEKLRDILNITCNPDVVSCDLHPEYMTSQLGEDISQKTGVTLIKSQHHHAHIASVAAENKIPIEEEIIGIALDGAGYGTDGLIWGGEVLKSSYSDFERKGHLEVIPMPGGDLCTFYPYRMLISSLTKTLSNQKIRDITINHIDIALPYGQKELNLILNQSRKENIYLTSSSGRFLDSIAALIGLTYYRSYEGEPAMKLETIAAQGNPNIIEYNVEIKKINGKYVLSTSNIINYLINNLNNFKKQDIAAFSQKYLSLGVSEIAKRSAYEEGIKKIGLSGGVFVNEYITKTIQNLLKKDGFIVLTNNKIPPGDGGTSLGQSVIGLKSVM
jgi:hydrogenase maturation protein HypF